MFKRLLAWFRPTKVEEPEYFAWVLSLEDRGVRRNRGRYVKVARPTPTPAVRTGVLPVGEDRPLYVETHGSRLETQKANGRAWLVNKLPDECVFM